MVLDLIGFQTLIDTNDFRSADANIANDERRKQTIRRNR